jgi:hypothetical protein
MSKLILALTAAGLLLVPVAGARAQDDPKEIIKKAITAHGGAEKLNKYKAGKYASKGTLSIAGMDVEFTNKSVYMFPDKARSTISIDVMGMSVKITQTVRGDKISTRVNDMEQELPENAKDEMKLSLVTQRIIMLTPILDDKAFELKTVGDAMVNGKPAVGVEIKIKDGKPVTVYFDKESSLMVKMERQGLDPSGGQEVKHEIYYSDYKEFDGVKRATKMKIDHNGQKFMEATVSEIKLLEKVDDADFSD